MSDWPLSLVWFGVCVVEWTQCPLLQTHHTHVHLHHAHSSFSFRHAQFQDGEKVAGQVGAHTQVTFLFQWTEAWPGLQEQQFRRYTTQMKTGLLRVRWVWLLSSQQGRMEPLLVLVRGWCGTRHDCTRFTNLCVMRRWHYILVEWLINWWNSVLLVGISHTSVRKSDNMRAFDGLSKSKWLWSMSKTIIMENYTGYV